MRDIDPLDRLIGGVVLFTAGVMISVGGALLFWTVAFTRTCS